MADKITNFEDYKKRGDSAATEKNAGGENTTVKNGDTGLIESIEIVDPYNFFTEEEREEYFKERQRAENPPLEEAQSRDEMSREQVKPQEKPAPSELEDEDTGLIRKHHIPRSPRGRIQDDRSEEKYEEEIDENYDGIYVDDDYDDVDEEYEDEEYEEDYEDEAEESEGKDLMLVVVRFASILTGIVILAAIAFGVYKFLAPRFRPDPDEEPAQEVQVALPEGFEEKGDMVTVTALSLNLRTVPSSDSSATVVTSVPKGTTLKRIAQSSETTWAIVEYEGQQLYASSQYLEAASQ